MTSLFEIAFLTIATFFCTLLTVTAGAGGGVLLLAIMLQLVPPAIAIPAHGFVQIFANMTRTWIFRRQLVWPVIWRFALLLPVGSALGLLVFQGLPENVVKMLIGGFVLLTLASGHLKKWRSVTFPVWAFLPVGFITGVLNMVVGVIGPVLAALVVRYGMRKEAVVGTLGVFGVVGNFTKIVGFGLAGFPFSQYWLLFVLMIPAAILGMNVGKHLLWRVSEKTFARILESVLVVMAAKLIVYDGLGGFWRPELGL